jgi:hypothetical protein
MFKNVKKNEMTYKTNIIYIKQWELNISVFL